MKELEKMTEEERELFLLLKKKILQAHEEGIKRRNRLDNSNNSWSKPWFSI